MLAILSDLHLNDGTVATTAHASAFDLLRREIELAARANSAQELRLVLLGDIFDVMRTDWWFENAVWETRPWNGKLDPQTAMNSDRAEVERQFNAILSRIFAHPTTMAFLKAVRRLAVSQAIPKLKATYVIGNHDRALNNFPSLQAAIQSAMQVPVEFANAFSDPAYAVAARHGHEWDDNCSARVLLQEVLQPKKKWDALDPAINLVQNIGEVVTAELMSGLVYRVRKAGDPVLTEIIKHVDLVRPAAGVFQWIEWQARNRKLSSGQKQLLAQALIDALSGVVDSAFGRLWDKIKTDIIVSGDLVDRLELARHRLRSAGYEGLRQCAKLLAVFSGDASPNQAEDYVGAKKEFDRLGPEIQYLVYGHTHFARHDCLAGTPDGRVQLYINTGTYLPLLQAADDGRGFALSHQMTLAFFYNAKEDAKGRADAGPTLELWNGIKRKQYK